MIALNSRMKTSHVILTGTDPNSSAGGIGVALKGYLSAIESAGISFEAIPSYHPVKHGGRWFLWLKALPCVWRSIKKARTESKRPIIYSHAGAGYSLFREACLLLLARMGGARTILQIHASQVDSYLKSGYKKFLFNIALMCANQVCLLTPWWLNRLREAGISHNLTVIPNPLPPHLEKIAKDEKVYLAKFQERPKDKLTVLAMTRLVAGKGVDIVIRAMAHLPSHVELIIAGDGNERSSLHEIVEKLDLGDRVQFLGWVSSPYKESLLESADIYCLASTFDAFPISFVEAMAYGIPVVGVKWGGIPDIVPNGRAGILVDTPEPEGISEAIRKFVENEDLRRETGMRAKRWVLEISSAEIVGRKLKELFEQ